MARLLRRRRTDISTAAPLEPSVEDAWRTLSLMVDWIKHAESKATATLATSAFAGGLLYTLVNTADRYAAAFVAVAAACAIVITTAAGAAVLALLPRLGGRRRPAGLIFYRGISNRFGSDLDAFADAYTELACDRPALFAALTQQIWANAHVAARKYRALGFAVAALLPALMLLAVTAVLSLLSGN